MTTLNPGGQEKIGLWVKLGSNDAQGTTKIGPFDYQPISGAEATGDNTFTATAQIIFASALCPNAF